MVLYQLGAENAMMKKNVNNCIFTFSFYLGNVIV